jgi:hypothetical protein
MRGASVASKMSESFVTRSSDGTFMIDCTSEASMLCTQFCSGELQTVKRLYASSHMCDRGSCLRLFCVSSSVGRDILIKRLAATFDTCKEHRKGQVDRVDLLTTSLTLLCHEYSLQAYLMSGRRRILSA